MFYTEKDFIDGKIFYETKRTLWKYNDNWKRISGAPYIGNCTENYRKLSPKSYYDFYAKYVEDGKNVHLDKKYRGRTEEELTDLAHKYKVMCGNPDIDVDVFRRNIILHTIIETFDGKGYEREVSKHLLNLGYTFTYPTGVEDSRYGIDFKVYKDDELKFILQVKPITFFYGKHNKPLIGDRICAFEKQSLVDATLKVPTWFMIYKIDENDEKGLWLLNKDGGLCHKLSDLINQENGYPYDLPNNFVKLIA